jgi:adenylylsulfate kinase
MKTTTAVIWFTGLSGAGKTTLATLLADDLRRQGQRVQFLDGDRARKAGIIRGFSRPERITHLQEMAQTAAHFEAKGFTVVAAFITPYEEVRQYLRQTLHRYIEVWVDSPLEDCESRDVKGLYARARRGEIAHFTGISDVYETPIAPDIHLRTSGSSVEASFAQLKKSLESVLK